jgi:hypothetical protein
VQKLAGAVEDGVNSMFRAVELQALTRRSRALAGCCTSAQCTGSAGLPAPKRTLHNIDVSMCHERNGSGQTDGHELVVEAPCGAPVDTASVDQTTREWIRAGDTDRMLPLTSRSGGASVLCHARVRECADRAEESADVVEMRCLNLALQVGELKHLA